MRHNRSLLKRKSDFCALVLCMVLSLAFLSCTQSERDQKEAGKRIKKSVHELPNIILIVLDTVSAEGIILREKSGKSGLSSTAEMGYEFTNCWATSDQTISSHFSIFSGMTIQEDQEGIELELDDPEYSLMNMLSRSGYRTYAVVGNKVVSLVKSVTAFDVYEDQWATVSRVFHPGNNAPIKESLKREFLSVFRLYGMNTNPKSSMFVYNRNHVLVDAKMINKGVKNIITDHRRLYPKRPFFLFINYVDAHDPYLPDQIYYDLSKTDDMVFSDIRNRPLPSDFDLMIQRDPYLKDKKLLKWQYAVDLSAEQLETYRKRYLAEIRELDHHLSDLLRWFDQRNLLNKSIIIITSDHGESFGEENTLSHWLIGMSHLKSTYHVPLIIMPEHKTESTITIEDRVQISDIAPTIYDILGIEKLYPYDGESLLRYFSDSDFSDYELEKRPHVVAPLSVDDRQKESSRTARDQALRSLGYLQ